MGLSSGTLAAITAISAATAAVGGIYAATKPGPKAQGQPQAAKDPTANVYKDRNAQNALVQGGDSTGTGAVLASPGNVAGNMMGSNSLFGQ